MQSQHFHTLLKAESNIPSVIARTLHTHTHALRVCELHVDELRISSIMLGAVKMEGHETSDWSSYYNDAQEVRENDHFMNVSYWNKQNEYLAFSASTKHCFKNETSRTITEMLIRKNSMLCL